MAVSFVVAGPSGNAAIEKLEPLTDAAKPFTDTGVPGGSTVPETLMEVVEKLAPSLGESIETIGQGHRPHTTIRKGRVCR